MGRFLRRALLRGVLAGAAALAVVWPGRRWRGVRSAAAAGGLAVGVGLELPIAGAAVGVAGLAAVARVGPRLATGVVGVAVGAGVAVATRKVWPVAPRTAAKVRRAVTP